MELLYIILWQSVNIRNTDQVRTVGMAIVVEIQFEALELRERRKST